MSRVAIQPLASPLGAEVLISADQLLDEGVPEACLQALNEHGVIVFPQIFASDEAQVEFSGRLGRREPSKFADTESAAGNLGIYRVSLDPTKAKFIDYIVSNEHWHMDGTTYLVPPKATNLKCEQAPSSGGDTEFANLFAAYDDLPAAMKARIASLRVVHSAEAANRRFFHDPSSDDLVAGAKMARHESSRWYGGRPMVAAA